MVTEGRRLKEAERGEREGEVSSTSKRKEGNLLSDTGMYKFIKNKFCNFSRPSDVFKKKQQSDLLHWRVWKGAYR